MTQGVFMKFNSKDDVKNKAKFLIENMLDWDFSRPLAVKLEQYQDPRSLSQNALLHIWCREIAKGMHKKGVVVTEGDAAEAWKLWLKKRFLGTDNFVIRNAYYISIRSQIRSRVIP